jgi:hypothetical protein
MQGNFLSRYENKISDWEKLINDDPENRTRYESEMAAYIIACMPYMNAHAEDEECQGQKNTDNVFNAQETIGLQRKDIYNEYLYKVEGQTDAMPMTSARRKTIEERCTACDSTHVVHFTETSDLVCEDCGTIVDTIISQELTYREEQESTSKIVNYSYKRENHFQEWLSQFQAQEMTTIPDDVIDLLKDELKKQKIQKRSEITHAKVRGLLKKNRLNKYYEHVPFICNLLNGIKAPKMPQVLEERLRMMFRDIQGPFDKHCPAERKNFLSYSYVLYKFVELLEEDEYLKYFPLLKSKEKLFMQDQIWRKICATLNWEFIATI